MRMSGILNVWFPEKRYGFIHQDQNGEVLRHFLHEENIKSGTPKSGATVKFKSVGTRKGYLAVDAEIVDGGAR
jgi:cold shock CspA family protein